MDGSRPGGYEGTTNAADGRRNRDMTAIFYNCKQYIEGSMMSIEIDMASQG